MDLQPRIAQRLGLDGDADRLMTELHSAARVIEHRGARASDALAEEVLGGPRRSGLNRILDRDVGLEDGVLVHRRNGDTDRLSGGMRLLAARAKTGTPIAGSTLEWLASCFRTAPPQRWPDATRTAFLSLLRAPHAAATLELLDHVGGWDTLLPEWGRVRGLAQHDPYHRYTVDGHSFLTVGELAHVLADQSPGVITSSEDASLDVLYLAALLHDVGKGSSRDHSVEGERLARAACLRMGVTADELEEVAMLVRHHLVLADVATRRDLDDAAVISEVAATVGTTRRLRLLYILSVADGLATGPAAWSDWKAALVLELYRKVMKALESGQEALPGVGTRARDIEACEPALRGQAEELLNELPPSYSDSATVEELAGELVLMLSPPRLGEVAHRIDEHPDTARATLTVCTRDRPGTLARTSGVLTLNRISVLRAQAYSTSSGLALQRLVVATRPERRWESVLSDLRAAYSGRTALDARVARKARDYLTKPPPEVDIRVLQEASSHSTIVEIRAPDALGLLYAVVAGLSDLDLDIHVAKIDTRQGRVVDVFYVRTLQGTKLHDDQTAALRHCVDHRLKRTFGNG
jgi:[protein-PII] uridylyltransferase